MCGPVALRTDCSGPEIGAGTEFYDLPSRAVDEAEESANVWVVERGLK